MKQLIIYIFLFLIEFEEVKSQQWNSITPSPNTYVKTLFTDTANNKLCVGGIFDAIGNYNYNYFAIWDGITWSTLGTGTEFSGGTIQGIDAIEIYNNNIYVGGDFSNPGNSISVWDGTSWNSVSSGVYGGTSFGNSSIMSLKVYNGNLFALGSFRYINVPQNWDTVNSISYWDGTQFNQITDSSGTSIGLFYPQSPPGFEGKDIEIQNNELYIGGFFSKICGISTPSQVAKYDGNSWQPVGNYLPIIEVNSLCFYNNNLYAAGIGNSIWEFNGTNWILIGQLNVTGGAVINAMKVYNNSLVIAGIFDTVNNVAIKNIARWNGNSWTGFGTGITNLTNSAYINTLEIYQGNLYVGGAFSMAGGVSSENLAYWNEPNSLVENTLELKISTEPNPVTDILTVKSSQEFISLHDFSITDLFGREISCQKIYVNQNSFKIYVENLADGIYLYHTLIKNRVVSGKFLKI